MSNNEINKKIKVLAYCDSPTCATGFGTVSRNILTGLYNTGRYDIDILGINYWGEPHDFPFRIWPTGINNDRDPYGRKKSFGMIQQMDFDIAFFLQDTFILDFLPALQRQLIEGSKKFKSICYYPIDGIPKEQWIKNVDACDYLVAYSEFGKRLSEEAYSVVKEPLVIPHGVSTFDYIPISVEDCLSFKARFFGSQANKCIFTNVNRNQQRKDIPRTIAAFKKFHDEVPDSILYLHCAKVDQGWNLEEAVNAYGLSTSTDVIFPENFGPNQGYPRQILNLIYNISDCVISTTLGEGFGMTWIEAMATKTPVIMPDNTAMTEFITEDRGWLVGSGSNASLYTVVPNDNEVIRPLTDVDDLVEKMFEVYNNKEEAKKRASNAYDWVTNNMDWQKHIVPQWIKLFDEAVSAIKTRTVATTEAGGDKVLEAESF